MAFLIVEAQIDSKLFCIDCDFVQHDLNGIPFCSVFYQKLSKNSFGDIKRCKQCKKSEKEAKKLSDE